MRRIFLGEYPSSDTLIIQRLENQIIKTFSGTSLPKELKEDSRQSVMFSWADTLYTMATGIY